MLYRNSIKTILNHSLGIIFGILILLFVAIPKNEGFLLAITLISISTISTLDAFMYKFEVNDISIAEFRLFRRRILDIDDIGLTYVINLKKKSEVLIVETKSKKKNYFEVYLYQLNNATELCVNVEKLSRQNSIYDHDDSVKANGYLNINGKRFAKFVCVLLLIEGIGLSVNHFLF